MRISAFASALRRILPANRLSTHSVYWVLATILPAMALVTITVIHSYESATVRNEAEALRLAQVAAVYEHDLIASGWVGKEPETDVPDEGLAIVLFDRSQVEKLAAELSLPADAAIVVLNRFGTILLHRPGNGEFDGIRFPGLSSLEIGRRVGLLQVQSSALDGTPRQFSFVSIEPIPNRHMYIGIGLSRQQIYAQARRDFLLSLSILALLGGLSIVAIRRRITQMALRPARALLQAARGLRAGDLSLRGGPPYPDGEIGELALAFDQMAGTLEQRQIEKARAVETLRESEERFRALIEHGSDAITLVDRSGTILYTSPSVRRILGLPVANLVGRSAYDLVHPDDLETIRARLAGVASEPGVALTAQFRLRHRDGSWRWMEGLGRNLLYIPAVGAIVVNYRDVTERLQAEEAMRDNEASYAAIVRGAIDGIITLDANCRIVGFNPASERMFALSEGEARGRSIRDLVTSGRVCVPFDVKVEGRAPDPAAVFRDGRFETEGIRSDGRRFPVEVAVLPVQSIRGRKLVTAYIRDIGAQKRYEESLRNLSLIDPLTGLHNRRGFMMFARQQIKIAHRTGASLWLLFADMDGLKEINDTLGHTVGDEALVEIADVLRTTFRESDVIARLGGDEFVVLAVDAAPVGGIRMTERLRRQIDERNRGIGKRFDLSLSTGWARYDPDQPRRIEELLAEGDRRMYAQKRIRRAEAGRIEDPAADPLSEGPKEPQG